MTQQEIVASLPEHLRPFVKIQDYDRYTARDHAVWRYLLKYLSRHLAVHAHPVYLEGLKRTGIALDHIPSIDEMNSCLAQLGWRAVVVDGFIPPAIFMEFQALKVLVIALDMRSVDHMVYTPAPDIVHEAAGHAPFIVDVDYAEFLQRFGEVGMKAIANQQDMAIYEAIRLLSILKEQAGATEQEIEQAEAELKRVSEAEGAPSEASLLSRLHWWTVEYGLVGELDDYRIFGAGLLSSMGESVHCLNDELVKKRPLTVDAVTSAYDITVQQPQLFVTKSCKHLSQVLEEYAASMCFVRGGAESLGIAIQANTICTAQYDSGMQVSGVFSEVLCDAVGNAIYLRTSGPTQLAWRNIEIYGQGIAQHPEGFGSPVGMLKDFSRCLSEYTFDELKAHNIVIGETVLLEFLSGITVRGRLTQIVRQGHRNLVLSFDDCTVTDLQERVLFDPSWGCYDMAVGSTVESVFGGAADRDSYRLYEASSTSSVETPESQADQPLMSLYADIDEVARGESPPAPQWLDEIRARMAQYPDEWLLRAELLDLVDVWPCTAPTIRQTLLDDLQAIAYRRPEAEALITRAIAAAG
ncbi:MAG: aromatic amino acid hydroxylase [Halioglobus sp.]